MRLIFAALLVVLLAVVYGQPAGQACSGRYTLTAMNGSLTSGPSPYGNRMTCEWLISVPAGNRVMLTFSLANMECGWDAVYIYDGYSTYQASSELGTITGNLNDRLPPTIVSTGNYLTVRFTSDENLSYDGFIARYYAHPCPNACNGRGSCVSGTCSCNSGYSGESCERVTCPGACGGRGSCQSNGYCLCSTGWTGDACNITAKPNQWRVSPLSVGTTEQIDSLRRTGAVMVALDAVPSGGPYAILLYGGFEFGTAAKNDLWLCDANTRAWSQLFPTGATPTGVVNAAATQSRGFMFVFGGISAQPNFATNQLAIYNISGNSWTVMTSSGSVSWPTARAYAASARIGDIWYIYGGYSQNMPRANDMWAFSTVTRTWIQLAQRGPNPGARLAAAMVAWLPPLDPTRPALLLFAGDTASVGETGGYQLNDVWRYSPALDVWTQLNPGGSTPGATSLHSLTMIGDVMLTYGGRDFNGATNNCYLKQNIVAYHAACNQWAFLTPSGTQPQDRYGSAQVVGSNTTMAVMSGYQGLVLSNLYEYHADPCAIDGTRNSSSGCPYITQACNAGCASFSTCGNCAGQPGCGWCASTGQCQDTTMSTCDAALMTTCTAVCTAMSSCQTCQQTPGCGWCASGGCMAGTAAGANGTCPSNAWMWQRCTCDYGNCGQCTADSQCKWCPGYNWCLPRSTGTYLTCNTGCGVGCAAQSSCQNCLAYNFGCLWCEATSSCFDSVDFIETFPWATCWRYSSQSSNCPAACGTYSSCGTCLSDPRCGWCAKTGTCELSAGNSSAQTICAGSEWNQYECPCSTAENAASCSGCVADSRCAWCSDTGLCEQIIPGTNSTCAALDKGTCYNCGAVSSNCTNCNADSKCGWCSSTQSCVRASRTALTPATCPVAYDPKPTDCTRCSVAGRNCSSCGTDPGCGFCFADGTCHRGSTLVPYDTNGTACLYNYGSCDPVPCGQFKSCSTCRSDLRCGWCAATQTCQPGNAAGSFGSCPIASLWDYQRCPCDGLTNCSACASDNRCGWCPDTGACERTDSSVSYQGCSVLDRGTCPDCSPYANCSACNAVSKCGWCARSGTCQHAGGKAPYTCPIGWDPLLTDCGKCEALSGAGNCSACTNSTKCGYAFTNQTCHRGDVNGPYALLSGPVLWFYGECSRGPCRNHTSCSSCATNPLCGWCSHLGQCLAAGPSGSLQAPCSGSDWDGQYCPCDGLENCTSCTASPLCGWCADSGLCERLANGTDSPTSCTGFNVGSCPACTYANCIECSADSACGWCGKSQKCLPGGTAQPHNCPGGWDKTFQECTECQLYPSCGMCTDNGRCGYCGDGRGGGSCYRGDVSGPFAPPPNNGVCVWDFTACNQWCGRAANNCGDCLDSLGCGWCCNATSSFCTGSQDACGAPAQTSFLVNSHDACPPCEQSDSCTSCTSGSKCCAWCESTQTCMMKNPPTGGATCPNGGFTFATGSCPTPCSQISECGTCNAQANQRCAWCVQTNTTQAACVPAHIPGVCSTGHLFSGPCPYACGSLYGECVNCLSTTSNNCGFCAASAGSPIGQCMASFQTPACAVNGGVWFPTAPSCACAATTCGACTAQPSCLWCPSTSKCMLASSSASICPNGTVGSCYLGCQALSGSCSSCVNDYRCGFCLNSQRCVPGSATGPAVGNTCSSGWQYGACNSECSNQTSCAGCLSSSCYWCEGAQRCQTPTQSCAGPIYTTTCPATPCSRYSTCASCVADTNCGMCLGTNPQCLSRSGTCPNNKWALNACACHTTCSTCVADASCGMCISNGKCMPRTSAPSACPDSKWAYDSCQALCANSNTQCGTCTQIPECGYCVLQNLCTLGGPTGPTDGNLATTCADWSFNTCPAITPMASGSSTSRTLEVSEYAYFKIAITRSSQVLHVLTNVATGSINVYVSTHTATPSVTTFDWAAQSAAQDELIISEANGQALFVGNYYISVLCTIGGTNKQCALDLSTIVSDNTGGINQVLAWSIYFVGVFCGSLLIMIVTGVVIKRARDCRSSPPAPAENGIDIAALREVPVVPIIQVKLGASVAEAGNPYFMLHPHNSPKPLVFVVFENPSDLETSGLGHVQIAAVIDDNKPFAPGAPGEGEEDAEVDEEGEFAVVATAPTEASLNTAESRAESSRTEPLVNSTAATDRTHTNTAATVTPPSSERPAPTTPPPASPAREGAVPPATEPSTSRPQRPTMKHQASIEAWTDPESGGEGPRRPRPAASGSSSSDLEVRPPRARGLQATTGQPRSGVGSVGADSPDLRSTTQQVAGASSSAPGNATPPPIPSSGVSTVVSGVSERAVPVGRESNDDEDDDDDGFTGVAPVNV